MYSQDDERSLPRTSQRITRGVPPKRGDSEGYEWRSMNPDDRDERKQRKSSEQQRETSTDNFEGLGEWMNNRMERQPVGDELQEEDGLDEARQASRSIPRQGASSHCGMSSYSLVSINSKKSSKSVSSMVKMEQLMAEIEAQEELNKLAEEESKIQAELQLTRDRVARQQNLVRMKLELRKASLEENVDDSISVSQRSRVSSVHSKVSAWIDTTTPTVPPFIQDVTPPKEIYKMYSCQKSLVPQPNPLKSTPNTPVEIAVSDVVTSTPMNFIKEESHQQSSSSIDALVQAMTTAFSKISPAAVPQGESSLTTTKFLARQTHAKELPTFSGTAEEWIIFFSAYKRSTDVCGFTGDENLHRLRKSLKGDAYKTVQSLLTTPENVPKIISKLEMRFGQPEHIINAMTSRVRAVPAPREDKLETVIEFGLTVDNLVSTMIALKCRDHLPNPILLNELEKKLPVSYQIRWIKWTMENSSKSKNLETFAEWLNVETEVACRLCPPKARSEQEKDTRNHNKQDRKQIFATAESEPTERKQSDDNHKTEKVCYRCNRNNHTLGDCKTFARENEDARWNLVTEKKLCFGCLRPGHWTSKCNSKKQCGVDGCKSVHHHLLHKKITRRINLVDAPIAPSLEDPEPRHVAHASQKGQHQTFLKIVPVILRGSGPDIHTFGFLDEGAEVTLIEEDVADRAQLIGIRKPLVMQWTNDVQRTEENSRIVDVKVSGAYRGAKTFEMRGVRTIKDLSLPQQTVNQEELAKHWPHLNAAQLESYQNAKPTILIGGDNAHLIVSRQVVEGPQNSPLLSKTRLGWVIHGKDDMSSRKSSSKFAFHICNREDSDEILHQMVKDTFKTESFGVKVQSEKPRSREDKRAQQLMDSTTKRVGDRWETGLLWKQDDVTLPDSRGMAFHRLQTMERKMDKDPKIATWYTEKIKDYEAKGYVKKLSPGEAAVITPKTWYLPHFFALHPHKPDKPRLVFDAAAKVKSVSLNDVLVQGPDLLNPLPSVLMKFRQKKYAFTADIKEMFHQVKIRKEDLPSQRFLWRGTDRERDPDTFEIQVMFFGATSSPSSAQFVKNHNAEEFKDEFPDAYWAILYKHYMDDYLDSTDTPEEANQVIKDVIDVHQRGGFNICNWTSNSRQILEKIPEDLRAKEVKELDTGADLPTGRVLGLWWNHEKDVFTWILKFHKVKPEILDGTKTPTKREVLKLVMSLFDPLGFLAHFVIKAKILLQAIWRSEIGWDDEIPILYVDKWQQWISELKTIVGMEIPRCYSFQFSQSRNNQLHVFCDASEEAFSAVAYFRVESESRIEIAFVAAKTRVAPLKPMSIPRLELQAAVMASRLAETVKAEHTVEVKTVHFWSDSRTVLSWIRADAKRFKPFVSHRVGEIEELTDAANWHWVPTKENVADDATRGSSPSDLTSNSRWLTGPEFLKLPSSDWPKENTPDSSNQVDPEELEVRAKYINFISASGTTLPDIQRFSSWNKLLRSTAWMIRFLDNCRYPEKRMKIPTELSPDEVLRSEYLWWNQCQHDTFAEEISLLKIGKEVSSRSRLKLLSPYLDQDGILRVGGRLQKCPDMNEWSKNPIILDASHPFTSLLIRHYHEKAGHSGKEMVANELRQRYWIPKLGAAVKKAFHQCQKCKNAKTNPQLPKMGQLPAARVTGHMAPFTFTGMDYFGPMEVTVGRKHEKRYGVLFTCMTTRAVHLEIASSLTTDSAVMAIRRMTSRRGQPKEIFSDNGTNLRGAEKELRLALQDYDQAEIQQQMTTLGITWHFNPPSAPHMGGVWERLVRSVKTALKASLKEHAPREEVLYTLFTEAEAIVNSRPLTHVSVDPEDPEALTPNHFLIGRSSGRSPGVFTDDDICLRRQWRKAQRMADQFWCRWVKEYLPSLLRRPKWHAWKEPVKPGDVVLIVDDQAPRNSWPLGIINAVFPGKDQVIRVVEVRTTSGTYRRPVSKICVLDVSPKVKEDSPLRGPECCEEK